ncbi:Uracil DNA glycosylase superfamily protein [Shimia sp. SK013]|uniref:uracil-DNA glycosylase n=1 Tax=Shimia sp. SK013 TaxID=1389006 RepID=UPI0006B63671|nr:uracil-DNA glycosylase [Shimia sp. SK013]KPA21108.1 Uracil DNA glycosylase superfamily protein [Shimia sp. SK013]
MESALDYFAAEALLTWQVELGATEAILDTPVDRYETPKQAPKATVATPASVAEPAAAKPVEVDAVAEAKKAAQGVSDLDGLQDALAAFELCELKRGARNLVFADGNPAARVMIIGDAPGRDEDREGKPFVGAAGTLLDRMFGAIDMGRDVPLSKDAIYITNVLPWRPPQNRDPKPAEIAMLRPFVERHVEIVAPDVIVLMGNVAGEAVLGKRGITRMRGTWQEAFGKPVLPMLHPAYLLRQPRAKREAWADLLSLKAKLEDTA